MKLLTSVLLSLLLASGAWGAGEDGEQTAATNALLDYFNAFISLDAKRIVVHFDEPFMWVSAATSASLATRADAESWLTPLLARLKERGYGRSDWPQLQVKSVNSGLAIASAMFIRYKTNGAELERLGATYVLRKAGDQWKIAVIVLHDPSNVLKLE